MEKAKESNKSRIIEILTKSFDDNKSTNWAIKCDRERILRIRKLMVYAYDLCKKQEGVVISDDNDGAIIFDYPKTSQYNILRLIKDLGFIFNVIGPGRLFKVLKREGYIKKFHPKKDYIYLWFLGVLPESQRNGIGSRMMQDLIKISNMKRLPVYLETSNPRNLDFYEKFGFSIYHKWNTEFIGFPVWFMRREV